MAIDHKRLRQLYEAAVRDRNPGRFYEDLDEALRTKQIRIGDFSVRKLFEEFVPNGRELLESYAPGAGQTSTELRETASVVSSSQFAKINGQLLITAVMEGYEQEDFVFTRMIPTVQTQFSESGFRESRSSETRLLLLMRADRIRRLVSARRTSTPLRQPSAG